MLSGHGTTTLNPESLREVLLLQFRPRSQFESGSTVSERPSATLHRDQSLQRGSCHCLRVAERPDGCR